MKRERRIYRQNVALPMGWPSQLFRNRFPTYYRGRFLTISVFRPADTSVRESVSVAFAEYSLHVARVLHSKNHILGRDVILAFDGVRLDEQGCKRNAFVVLILSFLISR